MEFETESQPLDLSTDEKKKSTVLTDESFTDLNFIRLGSGAKSIIADIQTGLYVGAEQFTSAPFSVDFDGKVIASDITITGGSVSGVTLAGLVAGSDINIQGWSSSLVFSATDYRTVTWTSGTIKLADGTSFSIGTGNTGNMAALTYIYFDKGVSTTALQVTTTATTAVGANKILVAVAKNNTDTTSKATLQVFGGGGGQLITVDNIAANSASVNEFISNTAQIKDAIITNAKITNLAVDKLLAGSITSKAITLAITEGAGDVYIAAGKTDFTNTQSGFILGLDDSDSNLAKFYIGNSTTYLNWTGSGLVILGGTITGPTYQTATSGRRIKITTDQYIRFYNGTDVEAYFYNDSNGNLQIDADNILYLTADGSGDDIALSADDVILLSAGTIYPTARGDIYSTCDNWMVGYNDDNDGSDCGWLSNGNLRMKLDQSGDLSIDGTYSDGGADFAEMFESTKEFSKSKIPNGISVILVGDKIRPADDGEVPFGVISSKPTIIGNDPVEWNNKYLKDEFGEYIIEDAEYWSMYIKEKFKKPTGQKGERKKRIKGWSDKELAPEGAKKKIVKRRKENPKYNPDKTYSKRSSRPEWNVVGLVGRVRLLKGQPTNPNWIKLKDISDTVEEWLIK